MYLGKILTEDGKMNVQTNSGRRIACSMQAIVKNEYLLK